MKSKTVPIIITVIVILLIAGAFFTGRRTVSINYGDTFYATIESIEDAQLYVKGLEVNDVNHRGEYSFTVDEKTDILWHNTAIPFADLKKGAAISITFTGEIAETSPATIHDVVRIILLED